MKSYGWKQVFSLWLSHWRTGGRVIMGQLGGPFKSSNRTLGIWPRGLSKNESFAKRFKNLSRKVHLLACHAAFGSYELGRAWSSVFWIWQWHAIYQGRITAEVNSGDRNDIWYNTMSSYSIPKKWSIFAAIYLFCLLWKKEEAFFGEKKALMNELVTRRDCFFGRWLEESDYYSMAKWSHDIQLPVIIDLHSHLHNM